MNSKQPSAPTMYYKKPKSDKYLKRDADETSLASADPMENAGAVKPEVLLTAKLRKSGPKRKKK